MRLFLIAVLFLVGGACSLNEIPEGLLRPNERALIREAVDDVSRQDLRSLSKKMPPELTAKVEAVFPAMHRALPESPLELTALNTNVNLVGDDRLAQAVYQVKGRNGWALVEVAVQTSQGRTQLAALYIQPMQGEPKKMNFFRLGDASASGWAMLFAMAAAILVTIAAIIRIWRSGRFRHRWLWTLGSLVGFTTLKMNWSTSEFEFQLISFQVLSVSAFKQPVYAPWVLGVSIPAIALVALFYTGRRGEEDAGISGQHPPDER